MSGLAAQMGVMGEVGEAIKDCAGEVVVTRFLTSIRVKGRSEAPQKQTLRVTMSVQPLNQKERRLLPEGTRAEGRVKGYTTCELLTIDTSECKHADEFCVEGVNYVVDKVDDWRDAGGYFRIEAARLGQ